MWNFALLLILSAQPDDSFVKWAKARAVAVDASGFRKLDPAIRDARLIGVGESVHDVGTFLAFRRELLEDLVRRRRVTALVLEAGMPEMMAVDDYVSGRVATLDAQDAAPELRRTFEWLRAWNQGQGRMRPVAVYGADFPDNSGSIVPALDRLQQLTADPEVRAVIDEIRPIAIRIAGKWWRGAAKNYETLSAEEKAALTTKASALVESARTQPEWVRRLALLVQQYDTALRLGMLSATAPRDVALASNTLWAVGRIGRDEKAVYWAHNAHVQRAEVKGPALPEGSWPASGTHFAKELGKQYLAIGTAYGGASRDEKTPPVTGSVDATLSKVAVKPFLLLLRGAKHAWLAEERPMRFQVKHLIVPLRAFDAIVYFEAIH